jgi:hypothetical protein
MTEPAMTVLYDFEEELKSCFVAYMAENIAAN